MQLADLKWPDVAALIADVPVVIPIAALEQHGRHMPLFTDSMLLGEVIRRVAETLQGPRALHAADVAGQFGAPSRLSRHDDRLAAGLSRPAPRHGRKLHRSTAFARIVLVNGHGGNIVPAQQALFELRQKHRSRNDLLLLSTTYWTLGGKPQDCNPQDKDKSFVQSRMGHACEWETSMMLRIAPHLVGDLSQGPAVQQFGNPFEPASRAWITKDRTDGGSHRRSARRDGGKGGDSLSHIYRRRDRAARPRDRLGRQIVGRMISASGGREP